MEERLVVDSDDVLVVAPALVAELAAVAPAEPEDDERLDAIARIVDPERIMAETLRALDELAPPGWFFGARPGRQTAYGWWRRERSENARSREDTWKQWRDLVNMSPSQLRSFLDRHGREAGLSRREASAEGVRSGRDSARALLRMIPSGGRSYAQAERSWSRADWEWAGRQVAFIKRMRGSRGALRKGNEPTRKLLALKLWGHDPER